MQELRFVPMAHGIRRRSGTGGGGLEEGLELGDGRATVQIVARGFDVEAVDGEGEFAVGDGGGEGHGGLVRSWWFGLGVCGSPYGVIDFARVRGV